MTLYSDVTKETELTELKIDLKAPLITEKELRHSLPELMQTGFTFTQTVLASTPFAVLIYLVNAILWWRFIVWAIAQFSHLT